MPPSQLLSENVAFTTNDHILILNSAEDPFTLKTIDQQSASVTLAEDNLHHAANVMHYLNTSQLNAGAMRVLHVPFHDYLTRQPAGTMDVAAMNMLYQPGNAWMYYGLRVAHYALRPGGRLYVAGAKDRGIQTIAKRMQARFGNVTTLEISKGQRVLCAYKDAAWQSAEDEREEEQTLNVFANSELDGGTRLLLDALRVHTTARALDLGCGAGYIGLHIARQATKGHVVMVDVSLAAVAASQRAITESGLTNIEALASDGIAAVQEQRFDLVATNPPFHSGGIQTTAIAEQFIHEAARVLLPKGRFYLVANRFLKYEPVIATRFRQCAEIGGDNRYKVLRATGPLPTA